MERIDPNVRDKLFPKAWTPGISWVASAAILATTDDEIEVVPCSVLSAAPPELGLRSMLRDGALPEDEPDEPDEPASKVGGIVEVGSGLAFRAWWCLLKGLKSGGYGWGCGADELFGACGSARRAARKST